MPRIVNGDVRFTWERHLVDQDGVDIDISDASTLQFMLRDPYGTVTTKTAVFTTDGSDGKLRYSTVAGDVNEVGGWEFQFRCALGTSYDFRTEVERFEVAKKL